MQLSQNPQMSVRLWRITLPLPFHCGYEIESRIYPTIFHHQDPICSSPGVYANGTSNVQHSITYVVQQDTQLSLWLNICSQYV